MTLQTRLFVYGATRIANGFRGLAAKSPELIDGAVGKWSKEQARFLMVEPYPPIPPGSTYIRTYTLPTGWIAEKIRAGAYAISNTVPYSQWVVFKKTQAWMHRGRWWTAEDVIAKRKKRLTKAILKSMKDVL